MTPNQSRKESWEGDEGRASTDDMRLLLLLSNGQNGRVLSEKLRPEYDISTDESTLEAGEFDLCILDAHSVERLRTQLVSVKQSEEPVFLPVLLVVSPEWDQLDPSLFDIVDEVITIPLILDELGPRIESLLRNRRLSQELSQRDQVEQMAAIISHDLRNPLSVARGNLELGREGDSDEHLEKASEALNRVNTLVEDLLSFAKQEYSQPNIGPTSLSDVASRSWNQVETQSSDLKMDLSEATTVLADASRLQELFSNLFRNACEHNDEDVTITVGPLQTGFFVEDDGDGITETTRDIFETGYSTNVDGTGFGLAIVKRIADSHSWDVAQTESPEGGARFEVTGVQFLDDGSATVGGEF
ncbi:putative signal-transducing histidine kinase / response regulator [Haloferax larsenii JCM 13917]|nr:HAMP domain-containing sensor histidine kinase [Haloferax larsenii]ELZ80556.1 putative signal-transducing histidine kinase / response regulator [Haloferax larsenii JCM 13917]